MVLYNIELFVHWPAAPSREHGGLVECSTELRQNSLLHHQPFAAKRTLGHGCSSSGECLILLGVGMHYLFTGIYALIKKWCMIKMNHLVSDNQDQIGLNAFIQRTSF